METKREINTSGVIFRIFGVILIILGGMNCMLAWRGGFGIDSLFVGFLVAGFLLFIAGSIQRNAS